MKKEILSQVIDLAKKNKAQADVILQEGSSITTKAHMGELDSYNVSSSAVIGVRVIKDNKIGTCFSESLDKGALETMVKTALTNATYSSENEFEKIIAPKGEQVFDEEEVYSSEEVEASALVDLCLNAEKEIRQRDSRVKNSPYNGVTEGKSEWHYLNSNGAYTFERSKAYYLTTSALMEVDGKNSMYYAADYARKFSDIDKDKLLDETLFHAGEFLKGEQVKTDKYNVLFSTDKLASIFGVFSNIFSGKSTAMGLNPMKEKLGEQIAHKELTIIDTPKFKGGFSPAHFDSEGMPASDTVLLLDGQYHGLLQNSATAAELGMTNTHNASRSAKGSLGVSGTNTVFGTGSTPDSDISNMNFFEVVEIQGLHSGANTTSGEFSFPVSGYIHENGKRTKVVRGVTLSGNYFSMLNQIGHIGSELHSSSSKTFFAPKILFTDMSVAGS